MSTRITRLAALFAMVFLMLGSVSALDVDIDVPEISFDPYGVFAPVAGLGIETELNGALETAATTLDGY